MAYAFLFRRPRTHVMRAVARAIYVVASIIEPPIMFSLVCLSFIGGACAMVGVANMAWAQIHGIYFWGTMPLMDDIPGGFVGVSIAAVIVGEVGIRLFEQLFHALRI